MFEILACQNNIINNISTKDIQLKMINLKDKY